MLTTADIPRSNPRFITLDALRVEGNFHRDALHNFREESASASAAFRPLSKEVFERSIIVISICRGLEMK
jgi:hypothetical protein